MNAHPHNAILPHHLAEPIPLIPRQHCADKVLASCGAHIVELFSDAAGSEEGPYGYEGIGVAVEVGSRPAPPGYHGDEGEDLEAEDGDADVSAGEEGHLVFVGAIGDGDYHDDQDFGEDVAEGYQSGEKLKVGDCKWECGVGS